MILTGLLYLAVPKGFFPLEDIGGGSSGKVIPNPYVGANPISSDAGFGVTAGHMVAYVKATEWLEFTVNVPAGGNVDLDALPHDQWRADQFKSIDGAALLALIGGSFDLMPVFEGQKIRWPLHLRKLWRVQSLL